MEPDPMAARPGPQAVAATDIGLVRTQNQDRAAVGRACLGGAWYTYGLVADGMGGGVRGGDASRIAAEAFMGTLAAASGEPSAEVVGRGIAAAHRAVSHGAEDLGVSGSTFGTTLVAALVEERGGSTTIGNVGDSRAYLLDGGLIHQVTHDHSVVSERLAAGHITPDEAHAAPDRGLLTRAVGVSTRLRIDSFGPRRLERGQVLILCSDGLHSMVRDEEIARIAGRHAPHDMPRVLLAAAIEHGGEDNVSVVVIAPPAAPAGIRAAAAGRILGWRARLRGWSPWPMTTIDAATTCRADFGE